MEKFHGYYQKILDFGEGSETKSGNNFSFSFQENSGEGKGIIVNAWVDCTKVINSYDIKIPRPLRLKLR